MAVAALPFLTTILASVIPAVAGITQRCERLARRLTHGEDVRHIIDSTGMSFDRASE